MGFSSGESEFIKFPKIAASIYDMMMSSEATKRQVTEIAEFLTTQLASGKLLDIGFGPGKLLVEIHRLKPTLELYGLDISSSMLAQARKNLGNIQANLYLGKIQETDFESDFFDIISCTGSFYLWNEPAIGIDEIHRLLKRGQSAYLFETYRDIDSERFESALKENLEREGFLRKRISPQFLRKQIRMTYTREEMKMIFEETMFGSSFHMQEVKIANLPIWVRIELTKTS
ncbi:MAG: methyltransferase domain-containing protein [Candidatus Thorarchaeota archaeon]|nr:methyltransferase domain-containing protein [Candidatus Thorarchaeota archaeon]